VRFSGDLKYDKLLQVSLVPGIMWNPVPSIRYGGGITFAGFASPYHVKPRKKDLVSPVGRYHLGSG